MSYIDIKNKRFTRLLVVGIKNSEIYNFYYAGIIIGYNLVKERD